MTGFVEQQVGLGQLSQFLGALNYGDHGPEFSPSGSSHLPSMAKASLATLQGVTLIPATHLRVPKEGR
jgi:hypothetical protein